MLRADGAPEGGGVRPFDREASHALYPLLMAPLGEALAGDDWLIDRRAFVTMPSIAAFAAPTRAASRIGNSARADRAAATFDVGQGRRDMV